MARGLGSGSLDRMSSPDQTPTTPPPEPPDGPAQARRLTRSSTDKMLGGVAGGLGQYFGVDAVLFRVGFAALTFAGGLGLFAYLALWLVVPDETGTSVLRDSSRSRAATVGIVVLAGLVALLVLAIFDPFSGLLGLLVLIAVVVLVVQAARSDGTPSLGRALAIAGVIVLSLVLGAAAGIAAAFGAGAIVAGTVIALGLALVVTAFTGRSRRWLIVPALALAAPVAAVAAVDLRFEGGVGERDYRPRDVGSIQPRYELGIGELVIDLRDVRFPSGTTPLDIDLGMGELRVIVPDEVCVRTDVHVDVGEVRVFGHESGGTDVDWLEQPRNEAGAPELAINADVGLGAVDIDNSRFFDDFDRGRDRRDRDDRDFRGDPRNPACQGTA